MKNETSHNYEDTLDTQLGLLRITAKSEGVSSIVFVEKTVVRPKLNTHIEQAKAELKQYFAGKRHAFTFSTVAKGTEFQKQVWRALMDIGYGETAAYSDIANKIGKPKAVRAVGAANGKNPLSIVVPCHRVIGKSGALTGYAGGIERKTALLDLENKFRYNKS